MSSPAFNRIYPTNEYETLTFPKEILYDHTLSGNALKLLLIMLDYGKRPNWQLRQTHLINESGFGYEKYDTAIKNLISSGYVARYMKKNGSRFASYEYEFSAFPIFNNKSTEEKQAHNESGPVRVSRTGAREPESPNSTSSNNIRIRKTTNHSKEAKPSIPKNLVSSSFEIKKLTELEDIPKISESQKATLYKKFSHDQIRNAIKSIDLERARSVFAVLYKALEDGWTTSETKTEKYKEAIETFKKADVFLSKFKSLPFSISHDKKFAYMYIGNGKTTYNLDSESFTEEFSKDINKQIKEFRNKK